MSTAAILVRAARLAAGLTQSGVAARSHIAQPNISRLEAGSQGTSTETVERVVRACGFRLAVLPGVGLDVIGAADAVRSALVQGDEDRAYRVVIQLADDLESLHGAERVAACVAPPVPSGDERFDALIAGVVETRLDAEALPHPVWLRCMTPLATPWWVDHYTAGLDWVEEATPPPLRRRGVFIDAAELVSA